MIRLSMLATCLFLFAPAATTTAAEKPNIVMILADDMGFSDIGCYGSEIKTPNLDRLAAGGIRFTQIHNTSKCFPSRACLLTGLYAQQCGMAKRPGEFRNSVYFGEVLRNAGYRTLFVGKHHSTENPYEHGFDHYRGLRDGAASYFNPGLQREGEPKPAQKRYGRRTFVFDDKVVRPFTPEKGYYATDAWTDWAIELLKQYEDEDKPFCLYLAYQAPHDPLHALPEDIAKYEDVYEPGYQAIAKARYEKQRKLGLLDNRYPRSELTIPKWEALDDKRQADQVRRMQVYAAMIDRMDQNIGRLLDTLETQGELDNTLILFASDNGASAENVQIGDGAIGSIDRWSSLQGNWANVANTPFRKYKNYSYEGGVCTPLIAHWPQGIKSPGRIDHTAGHFVDLMPTFIELAAAEYPEKNGDGETIHPLVGTSLVPIFGGETIEREQPLYFDWNKGRAVLTDRWKLVSWGDQWELYDRNVDLSETSDISDRHLDVVAQLADLHRRWLEQGGTPPK